MKILKNSFLFSRFAISDQILPCKKSRLKKFTYTEDVEERGEGVLIFGAWSLTNGQLSIIDGNLKVMGGTSRIRGIKVSQTYYS